MFSAERHHSNGVEGNDKIILRQVRSLVIKNWSHSTAFQFMSNVEHESELGIVPLHAHFSNHPDQVFQRLPVISDPETLLHEYVHILADNIALVRQVSKTHQAKVCMRPNTLHFSVATMFSNV